MAAYLQIIDARNNSNTTTTTFAPYIPSSYLAMSSFIISSLVAYGQGFGSSSSNSQAFSNYGDSSAY
jgi:hypothetical protein